MSEASAGQGVKRKRDEKEGIEIQPVMVDEEAKPINDKYPLLGIFLSSEELEIS